MIIVDTELKKRESAGNPIRVAIIGAGYMGRGLALQIQTAIPGMRVAGISNRTVETARQAFSQAGIDGVTVAESTLAAEAAIAQGNPVVTDDPMILCNAQNIDAVVEATGEVEFGAHVVLRAIEQGKHVILMNAELDALAGPLLKVYADRQGVIFTNVDGDQPGVIMNLFRFVQTIGYEPVLAGNIKGLQDHYRTPETQRAFAERNCQKPRMITSFADGTKISMEMAVVANATGFRVAKRGMYGPQCRHVTEASSLFPVVEFERGGFVDYVLGAEPGPGVFVIAYNDNPIKKQYMSYLKMGEGPYYVFYRPYHLPHLEAPLTVARAVLFGDAAIAPRGAPVADVITAAKRDLKAGEIIDGIGGYTVYGLIENHDTAVMQGCLPMSVSEGCRLRVNKARDDIISYGDVELPAGRLCDALRADQSAYFGVEAKQSISGG